MRDSLVLMAEQFVESFGLKIAGRDKKLVQYADSTEQKWEKLYKRASGSKTVPPLKDGADANKMIKSMEKDSKKRLKKYIKRKLKEKLPPKISVKHSGSA